MMNKKITIFILLGVFLFCMIIGCIIVKRYTKQYYTLDDFQSIAVGESTVEDVCKIALVKEFGPTGYGGICEFPMEDGNYILVKFYGSELVVGEIEISKESIFEKKE